MLERLKIRVYDILVETDDGELIDRVVAVILMLLILVNTTAVVLETVDDLNARFGSIFYAIEIVSITIFSIEYFCDCGLRRSTRATRSRFGAEFATLSP